MGQTYQQTGSADCSYASMATGYSPSGAFARLCTVGGTAGTGAPSVTLLDSATDPGASGICVIFQCEPVSGLALSAGNWTVNVKTRSIGHSDWRWWKTDLIRVSSACSAGSSIGSNTPGTPTTIASGINTYQMVVAGSAVTSLPAGESIAVRCWFLNTAISSKSVFIFDSQTIDAPFYVQVTAVLATTPQSSVSVGLRVAPTFGITPVSAVTVELRQAPTGTPSGQPLAFSTAGEDLNNVFQQSPAKAFLESPARARNTQGDIIETPIEGIIWYGIEVTELVAAAYQWDVFEGWSGPLPNRLFGFSPTDFALRSLSRGDLKVRQIESVGGDSTVCYWRGTIRAYNYAPQNPQWNWVGLPGAWQQDDSIPLWWRYCEGKDWNPGVLIEPAPPLPTPAPTWTAVQNIPEPPGWGWILDWTHLGDGTSHVGGDQFVAYWFSICHFSETPSNNLVNYPSQSYDSIKTDNDGNFVEEMPITHSSVWGGGGSLVTIYTGEATGLKRRSVTDYSVVQTYLGIAGVDLDGGAEGFIVGEILPGLTARCQINLHSVVDGAVLKTGEVQGGVRGNARGVGGKIGQ